MTIEDRISAFVELGDFISETLKNAKNNEFHNVLNRSELKNPWFKREFIEHSLRGLVHFLNRETLLNWSTPYNFTETNKTVALVMAGNIPLVGFHDLLSVLISGNNVLVKLSSKDDILVPFMINKLIEIEPDFHSKIRITEERLQQFDAIIATGSNNSSRYFEYYFRNYQSIIRKNRTSVAVLDGTESEDELRGLVRDILLYFGLGCRNVTKIFIPEYFDIRQLYQYIEEFEFIKNHNKYFNNYEYNRSIYLVNRVEHYDNGYFIMKEDESLFSPISVLFYEKYKHLKDIQTRLENDKNNLQCIVSKQNIFYKKSVNPGNAQFPAIDDYADDVDTLKFLVALQ